MAGNFLVSFRVVDVSYDENAVESRKDSSLQSHLFLDVFELIHATENRISSS